MNEEEETIRIAGTLCSPDDRFSKSYARTVAVGRLDQRTWPNGVPHAQTYTFAELDGLFRGWNASGALMEVMSHLGLIIRKHYDYTSDIAFVTGESFKCGE